VVENDATVEEEVVPSPPSEDVGVAMVVELPGAVEEVPIVIEGRDEAPLVDDADP
jgi:hypothetical protein